jgi:hypothetical protein
MDCKELDFKHGIEAFPKQNNKHHPFGNALKLPLAINNKTGKRAETLGDDLEPVDVIFITKVIELREPVKEAEKVGERLYLPAKLVPRKKRHMISRGLMRPCIAAALTKQLDSGEGHDMRVAVVCEALASGKSRDEIIGLFVGQDDYDETITADHVDYAKNQGYHPWKCETLQARCASLVDCSQCPHNAEPTEVLAEANFG